MILEKINDMKLTAQEEAIVEYIHKHPRCILDYNAKELSSLMYVSSSTIVRFTKKLGYKGYPDFQLNYTQEYMMNQYNKEHRIDNHSNIHEIIETLPGIYNQVFEETLKLSKSDAFIRTINYMMAAKQIDFYGNDNNYYELQSASLKFSNIGMRCHCFNMLNNTYLERCKANETLAFVVSHTGNNQTMVDIAYALRKKRIRVIGITGKISPNLELICNENLYIDAYSHDLPDSLTLYGLAIHYIIDILYLSLYYKLNKD